MELLTSLSLARSQAVILSVTTSVFHSSNQSSCSNTAGSDWTDGWLVFTDFDSDGVVDSSDGDELLQVHPPANDIVTIELLNSSNGTLSDEFVQFDNDGFINNSTGGAYFKFCDTDNVAANTRAIWVSNTGRASQSIDDGGRLLC